MPDLYADSDQIRQFASRMGALSRDTDQAIEYARAFTFLSDVDDSWLFFQFRSTAQDVNAALGAAMIHLRDVLAASDEELESTADYYQNTDEATAAGYDAQYS